MLGKFDTAPLVCHGYNWRCIGLQYFDFFLIIKGKDSVHPTQNVPFITSTSNECTEAAIPDLWNV